MVNDSFLFTYTSPNSFSRSRSRHSAVRGHERNGTSNRDGSSNETEHRAAGYRETRVGDRHRTVGKGCPTAPPQPHTHFAPTHVPRCDTSRRNIYVGENVLYVNYRIFMENVRELSVHSLLSLSLSLTEIAYTEQKFRKNCLKKKNDSRKRLFDYIIYLFLRR